MAGLPEQFCVNVDMREILARRKPDHAHLTEADLPESVLFKLGNLSDEVKGDDYNRLWNELILEEFGLSAFVIPSPQWITIVRRFPTLFDFDWSLDNTLALPRLDFVAYPDGEVTAVTKPVYVVNSNKSDRHIFEARGFLVKSEHPLQQSSEATELVDIILTNRIY